MSLKRKIRKYWWKFTSRMLKWFLLSFFGFISGMVIIDFIRKHKMNKDDNSPFLNDTVDGDYGAIWWLDEKNLQPSYWSAFLWWLRNHSWNYISSFPQPSTADKSKINVLYPEGLNDKKNLDEYVNLMKWSKQSDSIYGLRIIYYEVENVFCGRFSFANKWFTFQVGSGGDRYKFLFNLSKKASIILICSLIAFAAYFIYG